MSFNKKGFTVIEMLTVIILLAILVGLGWYAYRDWQRRVILNNITDQLSSTLIKAQQLAVASSQSSQWGVYLESDSYTFFKGSSYDVNDPDNNVNQLSGIEILNPATSLSDGAGGNSQELVFSQQTGYTSNTGTIVLSTVYGDLATTSITINALGIIE